MNPYVGSMGITKREIFGGTARNNYEAWFAGANVTYVHSARTAIQRAFTLLNLRAGDEILVPSYHCGSEVDALLKAGACVRLFRVSPTGELTTYTVELRGRPGRSTPSITLDSRRSCHPYRRSATVKDFT